MSESEYITIRLGREHMAMLDSICAEGKKSRGAMARSLMISLLEEDAASHQAVSTNGDHRVIQLRDWKGAR